MKKLRRLVDDIYLRLGTGRRLRVRLEKTRHAMPTTAVDPTVKYARMGITSRFGRLKGCSQVRSSHTTTGRNTLITTSSHTGVDAKNVTRITLVRFLGSCYNPDVLSKGTSIFGGSSVAERLAVNEMVEGSNPSPRAREKVRRDVGLFLLFEVEEG